MGGGTHPDSLPNAIRGKDVDADKYFEPFRLACAAKSAKIKESALDTLHKLIGARPAAAARVPRPDARFFRRPWSTGAGG